MKTIYIVGLSIFFVYSVIVGIISNGEGSKTEIHSVFFGIIAYIIGIVGIVFACINKQWLYIGLIILVFIVGLKIGGGIMRSHLSKKHYSSYTSGATAPIPEMPDYSSIHLSKTELIKYSYKKSGIMKQIEKMDKVVSALMVNHIQKQGNFTELKENLEELQDKEKQLYVDLYNCMFEMPDFHEMAL